jgi:hypothetical protein
MMEHGEPLKASLSYLVQDYTNRNPYCSFTPYQQVASELLIANFFKLIVFKCGHLQVEIIFAAKTGMKDLGFWVLCYW